MKKNWKSDEGKSFKFILITGKIYTGKIISVENRGEGFLISIKSVFGESIGFPSDAISNYEEVINGR